MDVGLRLAAAALYGAFGSSTSDYARLEGTVLPWELMLKVTQEEKVEEEDSIQESRGAEANKGEIHLTVELCTQVVPQHHQYSSRECTVRHKRNAPQDCLKEAVLVEYF